MIKKSMQVGLLTAEQRQKSIDAIIGFFQSERDEELGVIAAGELLDFFEEHIGVHMYNKAVDDTRSLVRNMAEEADLQLEELKRRVNFSK